MTTTTLPLAAALDPSGDESRHQGIQVVRTGDWPDPATILGHADSLDTAAKAREFWEATGCQATLPGYWPEGRC